MRKRRKRKYMFHRGERELQKRYGVENYWPDDVIQSQLRETINGETKQFVESLSFFFIATADDRGKCDASFRGIEGDDVAHPPLAAKVVNPYTLVFPDFSGNNLYNSLGNILVNPHIGILFIDFRLAHRLRINGRAEIIDSVGKYKTLWPTALRLVKVTVEEIYANCPKRIHFSIKAHMSRQE